MTQVILIKGAPIVQRDEGTVHEHVKKVPLAFFLNINQYARAFNTEREREILKFVHPAN